VINLRFVALMLRDHSSAHKNIRRENPTFHSGFGAPIDRVGEPGHFQGISIKLEK